jgi:hypothetical protein
MHGLKTDMVKTFDNGIGNIHWVRPGTHHRSHTIEIVENFRSKLFLTISNPEHPRQHKTRPRARSKEQGVQEDIHEPRRHTKQKGSGLGLRLGLRVRAKG